jgi:N-acetylglutamate synthase-like GNAT family acetyltransferase
LVDKRPAGRCGLYQVGDIARVIELSVRPDFANRGVERTMLAHVLSLARRLTMPFVLAQVAEHDGPRRSLMAQAGFVEDASVLEFETSPPHSSPATV